MILTALMLLYHNYHTMSTQIISNNDRYQKPPAQDGFLYSEEHLPLIFPVPYVIIQQTPTAE